MGLAITGKDEANDPLKYKNINSPKYKNNNPPKYMTNAKHKTYKILPINYLYRNLQNSY